ncbi:MAG: 4-hydroxybutyryl-CoA dehydratase [Gracilibacteraceae bacterium]|jgi:4-hydroxybutyryl-CoA dehydratase/vinylacetyl-CoA-Delta-isomerase|nr:4-hydroxybutyryl-CoA dehydratase [Gracilibacteraceae bacterium]
MKTGAQYEETLREMNFKLYMFGEEIKNTVDHPIIRPSLNATKLCYDMAFDPEYEDLMTAVSPLTGGKINRFTHLVASTEDLIKKVKMQRLMGQKTSCCYQRCGMLDACNAVYSITYEMDQAMGTEYHKRFKKFYTRVQAEDIYLQLGVTDPKGDRSLAQNKQADPDLYTHIVERRADGIIVRGAKCHMTGATNSNWLLVMPTSAVKPDARDYAIAFVTPSDAEGIVYVYGRQSCDTRKTEGPDSAIDCGNPTYGGQESLMVFDNLFVPWEYVLMDGETEWAGPMVERFATYHRQSYGGCKAGVGDCVIGAAALIAEYNGVANKSHIKDKLVEMTHLNEVLYQGGIAAGAEGYELPAGTYMVDMLLANCTKLNVTRFPYEICRMAEEIAGGVLVTLPSSKDLAHPVAGEWMKEMFQGVSGASAEDRIRCLRFLECMLYGTGSTGYRCESMHGAGSPQAQKIQITRYGNIDKKKDLVKRLAGIEN